jgi:hypothetical protein
VVHSAETMNLSRARGDKRVTKLLIGTVFNIPAASAETVAASAAVAVSALLVEAAERGDRRRQKRDGAGANYDSGLRRA